MKKYDHIECECPCGYVKLSLSKPPLTRFSCHCTICQDVYKKSYSDETVIYARDVILENSNLLEFKRHRKPPAAERGTCPKCKSPVVAFISLLPMLKIAIIPEHIYKSKSELMPSKAHIFYHRRVADVDDMLPKYSGYMSSQLAALRLIVIGSF